MFVSGLILTAACGGSLYKVKPVVRTPIPDGVSGEEAGAIKLRAIPLLTDEEVQDLFEANLLLAGVLPVRVELGNNSGAPIDLRKAQFSLRDADEHVWKRLSAKKAASRILDYYAVYLYNPNSRAKFEVDFRAHAFNTEEPLAPGEQRSGLLFLQSPRNEPVASPRGLVLVVEKLPQSLMLKLN